jgi:hypothetical protein
MRYFLAVLASLSFTAAARAQDSAAAPPAAPPPAAPAAAAPAAPGSGAVLAGVGEAVGVVDTATITAIDMKKHTVTLQGPSGNSRTYSVNKKLNLKKVKVGDVITVTEVDAVAISLRGPKSGPAGATETDVAMAGKGTAGAEDTLRLAAKITKIDTKKKTVTLTGPGGGKVTLHAKDAKNLQGLSVGDDVDVTFTQAVVLSIAAPKK